MGKTSLITSQNCRKNMRIFKDVDGIYIHSDIEDVVAPPPALEGGNTMELIYNKLTQIDIQNTVEHITMHQDIAFLKQLYINQQGVEEEEGEDDGNSDNDNMNESG
ncbi:hypothetical protein RYX36_001682 [Vicia faba]